MLSPQALSDSDHCQVLPPGQIQRARSGSRTYNEVQAEERELARRRTKSRERRERGEPEAEQEQEQEEGLSYRELKQEMETLLSLRRRSLSQPLTVDPDLPPSTPPPSSSSSSPSSSSPSTSTSSPQTGSSPSSSSSSSTRPKLSLTINTSHQLQHPTGGPISPTAPSPAETGTLIRRKSSSATAANSQQKLPSQHPLPPLPPGGVGVVSPINSISHFSSSESSSDSESSSSPSSSLPLSPSHHHHYQPNIIRSISPTTSSSSSSLDQQPPTTTSSNQELFWLPASLHPELAPQEFKAFIREQTSPEALARRTSSTSASSGTSGIVRSSSRLGGVSGRGVGRRSSMLRGEYKPRLNDGVDESGGGGEPSTIMNRATSLKRTGSQSNTTSGGGSGLTFEELTIKDLQKLEELAKKAEIEQELNKGEGEGEKLGRVLRRSLSLNPHKMISQVQAQAAASSSSSDHGHGGQLSLSNSLPASYGSTLLSYDSTTTTIGRGTISDDASSTSTEEEDFDSPLIVPPPGQILRRNARTKIRKTGPGGEISFGGYRSGGSRLGRGRTSSSDGTALTGSTTIGGDSGEDGTSSLGGDSVSLESHEYGTEGGGDLRASTSSLQSINSQTQSQSGQVSTPPIESPPLDGSVQYLENANPTSTIPHIEIHQPTKTTSSPPSLSPSSSAPGIEQTHVPVPVPVSVPAPPPQSSNVISPASAEYDWASEHLPQTPPQPQPQVPIPPKQQQYSVHPSHANQHPSLPPPTPQIVPIPQPERERSKSASSSTPSSSTSGGGAREKPVTKEKEKKSGWAAKLGLGGSSSSSSPSSEEKKKKGKGKEKEKDHHGHHHYRGGRDEKSETVMMEDRKTKESSSVGGGTTNSLFGGLFGRRRNDYDSNPNSTTSSTSSSSSSNHHSHSNSGPVTSPALAPPPPPTASGALLPNGRYANFYRLPIHVERAIYRLSHIKLANPRRPLYEQVLISNLMFWYLGLIQKPQPPPPAAPPVPVPGRKNNNNNNSTSPPPPSSSNSTSPPSSSPKGHKSSPSNSSTPAGIPIKPVNYENQDQQQRNHHSQQPSTTTVTATSTTNSSNQYQPMSNQEFNHLPLSSNDGESYPTAPPSYNKGQNGAIDYEDDDDDDRPLAQSRSASRSPQRSSYTSPSPSVVTPLPPSTTAGVPSSSSSPSPSSSNEIPPIAVATVPKPSDSTGFEVTSRRVTPPLGTHSSFNLNVSSVGSGGGGEKELAEGERDKRLSVLSNKSFSEIYEAYSTISSSVDGGGGGGGISNTLPPARGSSLQANKEFTQE